MAASVLPRKRSKRRECTLCRPGPGAIRCSRPELLDSLLRAQSFTASEAAGETPIRVKTEGSDASAATQHGRQASSLSWDAVGLHAEPFEEAAQTLLVAAP